MKAIRKVVFWLHLILGCAAGVVIFILCLTGAALVFQEKVDKALMPKVQVQSGPRLTLEQIKAKMIADGHGSPFEFMVHNDPAAPVQARWGHSRSLFLNPWTAEVIPETSAYGVHAFFFFSEELHSRFRMGMRSPTGAFITQSATFCCFILLLSGLYLWFPSSFSWPAFKARLFFKRSLKGRPRDLNWHNVIGIWTLIPMLIFVFTALVWSYGWAHSLVYSAAGVQERPRGGGHAASREVKPANVQLVTLDQVAESMKQNAPNWDELQVTVPNAREDELETMAFDKQAFYKGGPHGMTRIMFNPHTGQVISATPFEQRDMSLKLHALIKSWHTGMEWGMLGMLIAFLSCVGTLVVVWTGYSLSIQRYLNYRKRRAQAQQTAAS